MTYDQLRTIRYCVGGPYGIYSASRLGENRIVVFAPGNGGFSRHEAACYKWLRGND